MNIEKWFFKFFLSTLALAIILACNAWPIPAPTETASTPETGSWGSIVASPEEPAVELPESPVEPVTIKLKRDVEERIPAGAPVQLTVGWAADTEEQVRDFLAAVDMTGTLDGQPLPDLNGYWGEIEPREGGNYGSQGEDYLSQWLYPLGVLSAGTHTVEVQGTLERPVTDGIDSDNDGQLDEYSGEIWQFTLHLVVEE
jgi:hypothetical protein